MLWLVLLLVLLDSRFSPPGGESLCKLPWRTGAELALVEEVASLRRLVLPLDCDEDVGMGTAVCTTAGAAIGTADSVAAAAAAAAAAAVAALPGKSTSQSWVHQGSTAASRPVRSSASPL